MAVDAQKYLSEDSIVLKYPTKFKSSSELASLIKEDFTSDASRARAAYTWLVHNIDYDIKELEVYEKEYSSFEFFGAQDSILHEKELGEELVEHVLQTGKAVCSGYAALYKKVCNDLDIPCEVVSGMGKSFLKDIDSDYAINHSWNLVSIKGKQYLVDATWGHGYANSYEDITYHYFLTPPELFINSHYPESILKSLLTKPIALNKFLEAPIYYWFENERIVKLVLPKKGNLGTVSGRKIEFELLSDKVISSVAVQIGSKNYYPELRRERNKYKFFVDIINVDNQNQLHIFVDNEAFATYKIDK